MSKKIREEAMTMVNKDPFLTKEDGLDLAWRNSKRVLILLDILEDIKKDFSWANGLDDRIDKAISKAEGV